MVSSEEANGLLRAAKTNADALRNLICLIQQDGTLNDAASDELKKAQLAAIEVSQYLDYARSWNL